MVIVFPKLWQRTWWSLRSLVLACDDQASNCGEHSVRELFNVWGGVAHLDHLKSFLGAFPDVSIVVGGLVQLVSAQDDRSFAWKSHPIAPEAHRLAMEDWLSVEGPA